MSSPRFLSIRETAKAGPLSEYCLRLMQKRGELPGVYSGRKFLVNYNAFLEKITGGEVTGCPTNEA